MLDSIINPQSQAWGTCGVSNQRIVWLPIESVPALAEPMAAFHSHLARAAKELAAGWVARPRKRLHATLRHAVEFATWRSLAKEGLGDAAMADLVCSWAAALAEAP